MKTLSTAALAAKAIRQELKAAFPGVAFTVRSSNFSMGDSVDIRYTNAVPSKQVEAITDKYQYGHFDGSQDLYENTNKRDDIPQAKYVMVQREITKEVRDMVKAEIAAKFGITDPSNEHLWREKMHSWSDQIVWRETENRIF